MLPCSIVEHGNCVADVAEGKGGTMSVMTVEVNDTNLTRLLDQVQKLDEMILTQNGEPVARLLPVTPGNHVKPPLAPFASELADQDMAMAREIAAYEAHHAALIAAYENQYVALYQGQVVDHDRDKQALRLRLDQKYPDTTILVRKVEPTLPKPIYIRSPRLEKNR